MADFKSHITGSTIVGIGYGYWGVAYQSMSLESGILASGLCAVSGMLPDLDSDSGIPLRETSMFAAAVIPMLMIDRFRDLGLSHEAMALAAMLIYVAIRFVAVEFFKRYTVHRGMWHSIPAAASVGLLAYLVMPCPSESIRIYKSGAVVLGFMVHLVIVSIWCHPSSFNLVSLSNPRSTCPWEGICSIYHSRILSSLLPCPSPSRGRFQVAHYRKHDRWDRVWLLGSRLPVDVAGKRHFGERIVRGQWDAARSGQRFGDSAS